MPKLTKPWSSITGRLVLLYTLSASAILIVSITFFYRMVAENLNELAGQFLEDELHDFYTILQERPDDVGALRVEVNVRLPGMQYPNYYARILDERGQVVIETSELNHLVDAQAFPKPASTATAAVATRKWRSLDGKSYLLAAAWAKVGSTGDRRQLILLAMDISREEALAAKLRWKLILLTVVAIGISAGSAIAIARMGLQPLEEITQAAQRINSAQLHERIGLTRWPQELTALAKAFNDMLDRLKDSFARLSQFSADIAHELRTPINNLVGEAGVALSRARTPEEYQQVLESSLEEYDRLSRLIENLLFLARAESPETRIHRSQMDTAAQIQTVLEFYRAVAEEQGVALTTEGNEPLEADPLLFRQALSNVVSNALRHTPRGGKVTVSVKRPDPEWIAVEVRDTGSGIDPAHLPKVFDRFYRSDHSRSQFSGGAGLGLPIVKSIMQLHRGEAEICSEPVKGTTVILKFPFSHTDRNMTGS